MFGMFGTFTITKGKRDELADMLQEAARLLRQAPGIRSYVVYTVPDEPNKVGVFEVWDSREAHQASLQLVAVRDLITRARPLLTGPPESVEIDPLGGLGLLEK
jgi:quinol monooxygenase YgiN